MLARIGRAFRKPFPRTLRLGQMPLGNGWKGLNADDRREWIGKSPLTSCRTGYEKEKTRFVASVAAALAAKGFDVAAKKASRRHRSAAESPIAAVCRWYERNCRCRC